MKKQYLHLSVYGCDRCAGPVVAGSTINGEVQVLFFHFKPRTLRRSALNRAPAAQ